MEVRKISEFVQGLVKHGNILVTVRTTVQQTKNNKPYLNLQLLDDSGMGYANVWENNHYYSLFYNDAAMEYQAELQVSLEEVKNNYAIFKIHNRQLISHQPLQHTQQEGEPMPHENVKISLFKNHLANMQDYRLQAVLFEVFKNQGLMQNYFTKPLSLFDTSGASEKEGLLDFTNELLNIIEMNRPYIQSQQLNVDFLKFLAFVEPIGRIQSIENKEFGNNQKTMSGTLLPHPILTFNTLLPYLMNSGQFTQLQIEYIQHILLSVPGLKEWGAIWGNATQEGELFNRYWQMNMQMFHYNKHKNLYNGREKSKLFNKQIVLKSFDQQ